MSQNKGYILIRMDNILEIKLLEQFLGIAHAIDMNKTNKLYFNIQKTKKKCHPITLEHIPVDTERERLKQKGYIDRRTHG